jgi:hypothetical protein
MPMLQGIRGSTQACLEHFFLEVQKLPDIERKQVAGEMLRFMNVERATGENWAEGKSFPMGINLMKIRYFLKNFGYITTETESLSKPLDQLGMLIAYGVINEKKAAADLGFGEVGEMLRYLHGVRKGDEKKVQKIREYCEPLKNELPKISDRPAIASQHVANPFVAEGDFLTINHLIDIISSAEDLLTPLLKSFMGNDEQKKQQRIAFREKIGTKKIFEVSNKTASTSRYLNALCSEKAHEISVLNQKGGSHAKE